MRLLLTLASFCLAALVAAADPVTIAEFARRHGMSPTRDLSTGRDILKGASTVILAPGMATAVVDGRVVDLAEQVRVEGGKSVLGEADAAMLARLVRNGEGGPASVVPERVTPVTPQIKKAPVKPVPVARVAAPGRFRTIVIDPGHGGIHTGGKGARGTLEKDIALEVSLAIRDRLSAEGIRIVMTRTTDVHLDKEVRADLEERVTLTERTKPDLFLSIHVNWAENKGAQGFEVFYPRAGCEGSASERQAGRRMAEAIRSTFADRFDTPDRGVKEAGFYVIKNAPCPATLVELEFVSNVTGEKKLRDADYRKKLADAVADAVLKEHRR